ncbi:Uncharacterised protein [Candidatus Norongarragalina meridionalis]|nr:Uncharacterised protein [Candidatus Norongarragalina meridionalis]
MTKISLNQNVWVLLIGLVGLGVSELYKLETLYWFSFGISLVMSVSVCVSMAWYTFDYMKKKEKLRGPILPAYRRDAPQKMKISYKWLLLTAILFAMAVALMVTAIDWFKWPIPTAREFVIAMIAGAFGGAFLIFIEKKVWTD